MNVQNLTDVECALELDLVTNNVGQYLPPNALRYMGREEGNSEKGHVGNDNHKYETTRMDNATGDLARNDDAYPNNKFHTLFEITPDDGFSAQVRKACSEHGHVTLGGESVFKGEEVPWMNAWPELSVTSFSQITEELRNSQSKATGQPAPLLNPGKLEVPMCLRLIYKIPKLPEVPNPVQSNDFEDPPIPCDLLGENDWDDWDDWDA